MLLRYSWGVQDTHTSSLVNTPRVYVCSGPWTGGVGKARTTRYPPSPFSSPDRPPSTVTSQGDGARRRHRHTPPLGGTRHMFMCPSAPRNRATPVGGRQGKVWALAATVHLHARGTQTTRFLPSSTLRSSPPPSAHADHPYGERPPRIIARRRSERVSRWHPRGSAFVGGGGRPRQPRSTRRR